MLDRALVERYRVLVRWDGPKHHAFNTCSVRLQSFHKAWPHHNAKLFSAAGFFYTGTDLAITSIQNATHSTLNPYVYITICHLITGWDDKTKCFHCGGGLEDWLATDDPWSEHMAWFPNCIYIRYIRRRVVPPTKLYVHVLWCKYILCDNAYGIDYVTINLEKDVSITHSDGTFPYQILITLR
jgi:hypothetical protein